VGAITTLAEGLGIHAGARVFEVDPNTVLTGRVEAAEPLEALSRDPVRHLDVEQGQRDKRFARLSAVQEGEVREAEASEGRSRSPHWGRVAMDLICQLIRAFDVEPYRR
jgi:hypothetical protein